MSEPQCPSLSPESRSRCVLPDTREAHYKGHESVIVRSVRACWDIRKADEERWASDDRAC